MSREKLYPSLFKPIVDRIAALVLIIACSPIILIVGIILLISNRGRVFFFQKRIGKRELPFSLFKFRTMLADGEGQGHTYSHFGAIIRRFSIDELPQLFNVLKGDMSLVGPRPLLVEYLDHYSDIEKRRHLLLPGITGWSQIRGRNSSDWNTRMKNDLYYVEHISFGLDCKIIAMTLVQLFKFKEADFTNQKQESFIEYAQRR